MIGYKDIVNTRQDNTSRVSLTTHGKLLMFLINICSSALLKDNTHTTNVLIKYYDHSRDRARLHPLVYTPEVRPLPCRTPFILNNQDCTH